MSISQVEHPTINTLSFEPQNRKDGISGLMRVRNEEEFLAATIESWIDYIDELVIVFHQCTDNTPQIIETFAQKYPQKIRAFHYLPHVYSFCTKEQVELDVNNIHSFVFYSNFGLSQTQYKICVYIDGDCVGIPERLKIIYNYLKQNHLQNTALFFSGVNLYQRPDDPNYYTNLKCPASGDGDVAYWTVSQQNIFDKNAKIPFCEAIQFKGITPYYLGFIFWHTHWLKKNAFSRNGGRELDGELLEKLNNIEIKNRDKELVLLSQKFKQENKDFQNIPYQKFLLYFDFASLPDVISLESKLVATYNNLGYTLEQQGKFDEAVTCYQKALELQPNCAEAEINLGNALNAQGKLSKAQQAHYADLNHKLGLSRTIAGNSKEAINYYRQAIALDPNLLNAYYSLSNILQEVGQWEEAIASYSQALKLNPLNWEIYIRFSQVYQAQNKRAEAISVYRQALTLLNPHYAKAVSAYQNAAITPEMLVTPPIPEGEVTVGNYQFPMIPPVTDPEKPRPFWTVVIPVYNRTDYLLECLASVLVQWTGPEQMEILVMDNASTTPLFDLVNSIGGGIIRYYRNQQNIGVLPNQNAGISLSRGQWIHILHDDDSVVPGFYDRLQQSLQGCPDSVGAAFANFEYFNEKGTVIEKGEVISWFGNQKGICGNFLQQIGVTCPLQMPAVVIRRLTHEQIGGYYPKLVCTPEWELYKRITVSYDWWYEPESLARYRIHSHRQTGDDLSSGILATSIRQCIEISESYLPAEHRTDITSQARTHNFNYCLTRAAIPLNSGNVIGALRMLQEILKLDSSPQAVAKLFVWLTQDEAAPLQEEIIAKFLPVAVNNNTQDNIPTELKPSQIAIAP
ncbi:glycosyltransferase [Nostoc sp. DedQUE09]|uniref:glycosyltransferase n=1 Tax=Nostoc sp. DedQUE09 TaxID=3075394 RepID=UPI002AD267BF|nr:glycosyltransferase [Nostoc sp. DedQUE09]MDZ7951218.1 glycosyltransferase [Nostoc sp. DedQUE09]